MSEVTHKTLRTTIQDELGLKVKFTDIEQAYALLALLKTTLPLRSKSEPSTTRVETDAAPAAEEKPKKVKKAKVVSATEAELLAPADGAAADADAPTLGATDEFRGNKYRLQTLNPALCVARKIDEASPIEGTRPGDEGAAGKVFPEAQCSKKPIAGGHLCATCAKKETDYLGDTSKVPKGWYGRLDEELFHKSFVVGCEWFLGKYPTGIEGARPTAAAAKADAKAEKPKKAKKATAPPTEVEAEPAPAAAEKPKKAKKAPAPPTEAEAEPEAAPAPAAAAEKPKKAKKAPAAAPAAPAEEAEEEPVAKAPKPVTKKASVASSDTPKNVEWVTFLDSGVLLIRHTKTANVYQCDRSKHRLEDMVQRDKFEGKWRDGRLDPYAEEDDE